MEHLFARLIAVFEITNDLVTHRVQALAKRLLQETLKAGISHSAVILVSIPKSVSHLDVMGHRLFVAERFEVAVSNCLANDGTVSAVEASLLGLPAATRILEHRTTPSMLWLNYIDEKSLSDW
jgi:hypothetical protein